MNEVDEIYMIFENQNGVKDKTMFRVGDEVPAIKGTGMNPEDTWRIKKIEVK